MENWSIKYSDRYLLELKALKDANIHYEENTEARAQNIVRLSLTIGKDNPIIEGLGRDLSLIAVFPDLYPFFRPEVYAPDTNLPRHQNPFEKNLCLLPRTTASWRPEDTLADLLKSQLNRLFIQGNILSHDELAKDADEQAEPISEYYPFNNFVLFDSDPYEGAGVPVLDFEEVGKVKFSVPFTEFSARIAITNYYDKSGIEIGALPQEINKFFGEHVGTGVVCRVNEPPPKDPKDFITFLKRKGCKNILDQTRKIKFGAIVIEYLVAINFPEEVEPGKNGSGWLFFIKSKRTNGAKDEHIYHYGKALRVTKSGYRQRIPKLKSLADKKIAIIGLGALGGPSAIEFAKNGVGEIRIVDFDYVDPPTTIRWPLGMTAAGLSKTDAIKKFIDTNYPFTNVIPIHLKIGQTTPLEYKKGNEGEPLDKIFDGVSLIFDASAEIGVMNYLSYEAKNRNISYISIEGSEGAVGGQVMRVSPNKTQGCWMCLQYAQDGGLIPIPPSEDSGKLQPVGCGDLSFTGTSFDLQNICSSGVRLAVSTLCEGDADGYPSLDWDVSILSLVDKTGKPISPQWQDFKLEKHVKCPYCADKK